MIGIRCVLKIRFLEKGELIIAQDLKDFERGSYSRHQAFWELSFAFWHPIKMCLFLGTRCGRLMSFDGIAFCGPHYCCPPELQAHNPIWSMDRLTNDLLAVAWADGQIGIFEIKI